MYTDYATWVHQGRPWPHLLRGRLKEGMVKVSPYGPAVSEETRKRADSVLAQFMAGTMLIPW